MAKPVARTPKTPDARSPSVKKLPSGARRRTNNIAVTAIASTTTTIAIARARFTSRAELAGALQLPAPAEKQPVHGCGTDDRVAGELERRRVEDERPRL